MNISEIYNEIYNTIKSDSLQEAIVAIVIGGLILSFILGIWGYVKNRNFARGFLKVFNWLFQFLRFIISLLKRVLIFLLRPIVKPIVHEVLKENIGDAKPSESPIISEQMIVLESSNKNNWYYGHKLNLRDNKYKIHLSSIEKPYWRIGFKLSKDPNFTEQRLVFNYPLIHLTKNLGDNILRIDEYNQNTQHIIHESPILDNYDNSPLSLTIYNDSQKIYLNIVHNGKIVYENKFGYGNFFYSQLFAWGDENSNKMKLKVEKLENI